MLSEAKKSSQAGKDADATNTGRQRRARWGKDLPKPDAPVEFAAGSDREHMEDVDKAAELRFALSTKAWREFALPVLADLEAGRPSSGGDRYSVVELETFLLLHYILGHHIISDTRTHLMSPRGRESRALIGFDRPRNAGRPGAGRNREGVQDMLLDGVPSEATISRHRRRLPDEFRDELHRRLFESIRDEHLEDPDMQAECDELWTDGSTMPTHHTAPKIDPKTRKVVNGDRITCADGGYVGKRAPLSKQGHGFTHISILTKSALVLSLDVVPNGSSEPIEAVPISDDVVDNVISKLPPKIRVLSADSAFHSAPLRMSLRRGAIIPNIHLASHADNKKTREHAAKMTAERNALNDSRYEDWFVNGHRELVCRCGAGNTWRRNKRLKDGSVALAVEGRCAKCGSVSVTSGDWRKTQNPSAFSRCSPDTPDEDRDWALGNFLTYNNPIAAELGRRRHNGNEAFYGAATRRYGLFEKGWYRSRAQARARAYAVAFVQHAVAMEQRRRARAAVALPLAA